MVGMDEVSHVQVVPATTERWSDLESLFGERGAVGGCWCMYWRFPKKAYSAGKGAGNKAALHELVDGAGSDAEDPPAPGLLAYAGDRAVGWISVAPREDLPRLERSRILKPVDDTPVWSIVCLFIHKEHRRRGVGSALIRGAVDFVAKRGGATVEAYPVEPKGDPMPDAFAWTGVASAFTKLGFVEVARRSETRPILRFSIRGREDLEVSRARS